MAVGHQTRVLRTSPFYQQERRSPVFLHFDSGFEILRWVLRSRSWVICKGVGDALRLVSSTFLVGSIGFGSPMLVRCSGFFAPFLVLACVPVCDKWLLFVLFRFLVCVLFSFLETPTEGLSLFPLFHLPSSLSVLVSQSSLLSAGASSASFCRSPCLVCGGDCGVHPPLLPLRGVAMLSAPSLGWVRGGSCLFFAFCLNV